MMPYLLNEVVLEKSTGQKPSKHRVDFVDTTLVQQRSTLKQLEQ